MVQPIKNVRKLIESNPKICVILIFLDGNQEYLGVVLGYRLLVPGHVILDTLSKILIDHCLPYHNLHLTW